MIGMLIEIAARLGFGAFISWRKGEGKRHYRRVMHQIQEDDIGGFVCECVQVFREKVGVSLDIDDFEGSVELLCEEAGDAEEQFLFDGLGGYYAQVVGAYFGELMVRHGGGQWCRGPGPSTYLGTGGGLMVKIEEGGRVRWLNTFEKFDPGKFMSDPVVLKTLSDRSGAGRPDQGV